MSDLLTSLVADIGGNSHAARSARAHLQWRDRYGKFIEMGKGIKFKFRRPDGTTVSANGVFVGTTNDPNVGQVYVQKDPNGLKDGFYSIQSANAQEILGTLDPNVLKQQGVNLGQGQDGSPIGDRLDTDIPNQAQIPYSNAPTGWTADGGNALSPVIWKSDDNEFQVTKTSWPVQQKTGKVFSLQQGGQPLGAFKSWSDVLNKVNSQDADTPNTAPPGVDAIDAVQQAHDAQMQKINDPSIDAKTKAIAAIKGYDSDGSVENMINNNAPAKDVMDALSKNAQWRSMQQDYALRESKDFHTRADKAKWNRVEALNKAIANLDTQQDATQPDGTTGHNLDLSVGDVAAAGYLVPTTGNEDSTPLDNFDENSLASYIVLHKDELSKQGKRLSITTDTEDPNVLFDIADQVPDHNTAQQLASQRNLTEITDIANNTIISTAQGRPREDGANTNPDSNAEQPSGNEPSTDNPVDQANGGSDQSQVPDGSNGVAPQGGNPDTSGTDSSPNPNTGNNADPNTPTEPASPSDSSSTEPNADSSEPNPARKPVDSGLAKPQEAAPATTPDVSEPKQVGPSATEKIKNAETMHGTDSPQHKEAKARFGADAEKEKANPATPAKPEDHSAPEHQESSSVPAEKSDASSPEPADNRVPGVRPMDPAKVQQAELDENGLPNDKNALERTIARLEARAATVDGPALDLVNDQLARAYDKYNSLSGDKADAPEEPHAPSAPHAEDAAPSTPPTKTEDKPAAPKNELRDRLEKAKSKATPAETPDSNKPADKQSAAPAPEPQKAEKPTAGKPFAEPEDTASKADDTPAPSEGAASDSAPNADDIAAKATEQAANAPASPPKDAAAHEANLKRLESLVKRRKGAVEKHEENYGSSNIPPSSSYKPEHLRRIAAHKSAQDELAAARQDAADHASGKTPPARVDNLTRDQHVARRDLHQKIVDTPKREGELPKDALARREQAQDQVSKHNNAIAALDSQQDNAPVDATPVAEAGPSQGGEPTIDGLTRDQHDAEAAKARAEAFRHDPAEPLNDRIDRQGAARKKAQAHDAARDALDEQKNPTNFKEGDRVSYKGKIGANAHVYTGTVVGPDANRPGHTIVEVDSEHVGKNMNGRTSVKNSDLAYIGKPDKTSPAPAEPAQTNTPEVPEAPEPVQENTPTPDVAPAPEAEATPEVDANDPLTQDLNEAQADVDAANRMAARARARGDEPAAQQYEKEAQDAQADVDAAQRLIDRRNRPRPAAEAAPEAPVEENAPEAAPTPTPDENAPEEPTAPPAPENAPEEPVEGAPEPENTPAPEAQAEEVAPTQAPAPAVLNETGPDDGTDSTFADDHGVNHGEIALTNDGKYTATKDPNTANAAQASFDTRDDAEQWLGDQIAKDNGADVNPINNQPVSNAVPDVPVYRGDDLKPVPPHRVRVATAILEGKDVDPAQKAEIENALSNEDLNAGQYDHILGQIAQLPAAPSTRSKPRDPASNPVTFTPGAAVQLQQVDPGKIADPNLIIQDLKKNHPGYKQLANGDVVIESHEVNGKTYDLIVRRTANERFYPYIRETNENTGTVRAIQVGNDTHSYKALITKLNTAKGIVRKPAVDKWFNRKNRAGVVDIPQGAQGDFSVVPDPARDFIEHTNIARTGDQHTDQMASLIADIAHRGEDKKVLDRIAKENDLSPDFVDKIVASVQRKKINDALAQAQNNAAMVKKSHIPYGGGDALKVNDWVDWTDTRPKLNLGTPNEKDNPNFGRVYRGQVRKLRYRTNDGNGQYVYSDSTYVTFPQLNADNGHPLSKQRSRISSELQRVDGPRAPISAPFFPKKEEKAAPQEPIVRNFNLPPEPLKGEVLAPVRKASAPAVQADPDVDINGNTYLGGDDNPVAVAQNPWGMLNEWDEGVPQRDQAANLQPGDLIAKHIDGGPRIAKVVAVRKNGSNIEADTAYYDGKGNLTQKTVQIMPDLNLLIVRPAPTPAPAAEVPEPENNVARARGVGDRVLVNDMPGGTGEITAVSSPAPNGERTYTIKADSNGLEYPRQERYVEDEPSSGDIANASIQPANKQPDAAWERHPATVAQTTFIRNMLQNKQLSAASRRQILKALADPKLTKGQASQYITELKNHKDKRDTNTPKGNADGAARVLQGVADDLKRDPNAGVDGQHIQDAANAAKQDRALAEANAPDPAYGGYGVKSITYSEAKGNGFNTLDPIQASFLKEGDLVPRGMGTERRYFQVLENNGDGTFSVRVVANPDGDFKSSNGQIIQGQFIGTVGRVGDVRRPNDNAPKGYFKKVVEEPAQVANAPKLLNEYNANAKEMHQRVAAGYDKVTTIAAGAINKGAWYIQPDDNGPELFMKKVKANQNNREYYNEIIVSKMFNALGLNEVTVIGLADKQTIVQTKITGDMAANRWMDADEITAHPENYKNARLIGLIDYLAVNSDRHGGNWFVNDEGQPVPIDHGFTEFSYGYFSPTFANAALGRLIGRRNAPLFTKAELQQMKAQIGALREEFLMDNNPHGQGWYQFVMSRFDTLIEAY